MIISAIIRAFKAVIDAIAKVVAWLLLAFGLWVPLLYSLIFLLVVVLFLDIPLANTGAVYFTGLFLSFIGALWYSMARSAKKAQQRKRKKSAGYNVSEVKKKEEPESRHEDPPPTIAKAQSQVSADSEPQSESQPQQSQQYAPQPQQYYQPQQPQYAPQPQQYYQPQQPQYAPQPQQYYQPQQPQYAPQPQQYYQPQQSQYAPQQQYDPPHYAERREEPQQPQRNSFDRYSQSQNESVRSTQNVFGEQRERRDFSHEAESPRGYDERYDRQSYPQSSYDDTARYNERSYNRSYERRSSFGGSERQVANEQPRIFRLREDPDMLVYEYSDRLDYYRRTAQGNEFVRRKYKD